MVETELAQAPDLKPGQRLGPYIIESKLTQGGFGAVYVANDPRLEGLQVIIKTMLVASGEMRALFRQEARRLVDLRHPSLVQVVAFDSTDGFDYLVTEYLHAETLTRIMEREGRLDAFEAVRVGLRIAEALEAVHQAGVVHRDLKPDNVMVKLSKDQGRYVDWLKLIDFGLAHQQGRDDAFRGGSVPYVAPETLRSEPVTPLTDLYALGCVLYEMLSGHTPYDGDTQAIAQAHLDGPVRLLDETIEVPDELRDLVTQLMQKDQTRRPQSATEVVKHFVRIDRALADGATNIRRRSSVLPPVRVTTEPMLPLVAKPAAREQAANGSKKTWWSIAAAALLLLIAANVAVALLRPTAPPPAPVLTTEVKPIRVEPEVVKPEPVAAPREELEPLAVLNPGVPAATTVPKAPRVTKRPATTVVVTPEPDCRFDARYRDYARRAAAQLRPKASAAAGFQASEDELVDALGEEDCKRANRALNTMRRAAGVPVE